MLMTPSSSVVRRPYPGGRVSASAATRRGYYWLGLLDRFVLIACLLQPPPRHGCCIRRADGRADRGALRPRSNGRRDRPQVERGVRPNAAWRPLALPRFETRPVLGSCDEQHAGRRRESLGRTSFPDVQTGRDVEPPA